MTQPPMEGSNLNTSFSRQNPSFHFKKCGQETESYTQSQYPEADSLCAVEHEPGFCITPDTTSDFTPNTSPSPLRLPKPAIVMERRQAQANYSHLSQQPYLSTPSNALALTEHLQQSCHRGEISIQQYPNRQNLNESRLHQPLPANQQLAVRYPQSSAFGHSTPFTSHPTSSQVDYTPFPSTSTRTDVGYGPALHEPMQGARFGGLIDTSPITGYTLVQEKLTDEEKYRMLAGDDAIHALHTMGVQLKRGNHDLPFEKAIGGGLKADTAQAHRGVVKIGNIPFTVTLQEIKDFIKRHVHIHSYSNSSSDHTYPGGTQANSTRDGYGGMLIAHVNGYPIHIIMEKPTGKTMDAFVEFESVDSARQVVKNFEENAQVAMSSGAVLPPGVCNSSHQQALSTQDAPQFYSARQYPQCQNASENLIRNPSFTTNYQMTMSNNSVALSVLSRIKLGTRIVSVELSSQSELLASIFPRARLVTFHPSTGIPTIEKSPAKIAESGWTEGFRGYFTVEEIYGVVRFAENPNRSPFAAKCHQRVYESMISTLYKFPWSSTNTYSIRARDMLFGAVCQQMKVLITKVGQSSVVAKPTGYSAVINTSYPDQRDNWTRSNSGLHPISFDQQRNNQYVQYYQPGYDASFQPNFRHGYFSHDTQTRANANREVGLSTSLLMDLLFAGLNVPCFSLLQRAHLCDIAGDFGVGVPLSPFALCWPFSTLQPSTSASNEAIKFYLELFDTGFDVVEQTGESTSFEKYVRVSRNQVGFPIIEWTSNQGIELCFEEAMMIESALASFYLDRGRQLWCYERGIADIDQLKIESLEDLIASIEDCKLEGKHVANQNDHNRRPSMVTQDDSLLSPKQAATMDSFNASTTSLCSMTNRLNQETSTYNNLSRNDSKTFGQGLRAKIANSSEFTSQQILSLARLTSVDQEHSLSNPSRTRSTTATNLVTNANPFLSAADNTFKDFDYDIHRNLCHPYGSAQSSNTGVSLRSSPGGGGGSSECTYNEDVNACEILHGGPIPRSNSLNSISQAVANTDAIHVQGFLDSKFLSPSMEAIGSRSCSMDKDGNRPETYTSPHSKPDHAIHERSLRNAGSDPLNLKSKGVKTPDFGPIGGNVASPPSSGRRSRATTRSKINIDQTIHEEIETDHNHTLATREVGI